MVIETLSCSFYDFANFFDTIDIPIVIDNTVKSRFPPAKLAFLIQQHLAPRAVQANGFTANPVAVYKSILAGCKSSIGLTRGYLKKNIKYLHYKYPK